MGIALLTTAQYARAQESGMLSIVAGRAAGMDELRRWDAAVDGMARTGDLVVMSHIGDAALEGRTHEYLAQYFAGIPVFGGGVSRQLDEAGVTVSLFGTLHQGIDVDLTSALSGPEIAALLEEMHGGEVVAGGRPALGILPLLDGSYALAWLVPMSDGQFYFADANDGHVIQTVDAHRTQTEIGEGTGYNGDRKKLGTTRSGDRFEAHDRTRPGEIVTFDARFNSDRLNRLLDKHFIEGLPEGEPVWTADDVAADADNEWDDAAIVDAHAHTGWTYDYFAQQHGWEGLDGENGRILSIANIGIRNAFFIYPPFGPEGTGALGYGRGEFATDEEPWTNLDTVGHEMMHGVTAHAVIERTGSPFGLINDLSTARGTLRLGPRSFTNRAGRTRTCATTSITATRFTPAGPREVELPAVCIDGRFLLGAAQANAADEGLSDIFGEAVGFFHEDIGASADYLSEGDQERPVLRSLIDPRSVPLTPRFPQYVYPDTYGDRYEFPLLWLVEGKTVIYSPFLFQNRRYALTLRGLNYGAQHWNSTILSHAFYLAIEGGTHRTGMTVEGVGGANRAEIERIFFRAITELMPARTSLPIAAAVIRQAAFDLAPGGNAQRAVHQALRAVGL
jgi:Zn-dependent metalloprotease